MRNLCEISGRAVFSRPSIYKKLSDMPVAKAVRSVEAEIIHSKITESNKCLDVFSIGVGRGELYKNFLRKELADGRMRLFALETDGTLVAQVRENFPGKYMDVLGLKHLIDGFSSVVLHPEITVFDIPDKSVDLVETSFTMNSFIFRENIIAFLKRIYNVLKPNGTLVLADIDCHIGSYIEGKIGTLRRFFKNAELILDKGMIVGTKNKKYNVPILDLSIQSDMELLQNIFRNRLVHFKREAASSAFPEWEQLLAEELAAFKKGQRFYRTKEEWESIVSAAFGSDAEVKVISSDEIRRSHPKVLDRPFVIVASKIPTVDEQL